jgi:hypothetical protein
LIGGDEAPIAHMFSGGIVRRNSAVSAFGGVTGVNGLFFILSIIQ